MEKRAALEKSLWEIGWNKEQSVCERAVLGSSLCKKGDIREQCVLLVVWVYTGST